MLISKKMKKRFTDQVQKKEIILNKVGVFLGSVFLIIGSVHANPVVNNVASGNITITQSPSTNTETITQTSQKGIINWNSFNIGAQETTQFIQPNPSSITLNRISPSQGASQIYGHLISNGQIILINQSGIYFGPGAQVDVGAIIASTSDMANSTFLNGSNYVFNRPSTTGGSIVNEGSIIAANHGLVALVGTSVSNTGFIKANLGQVDLGGGSKFTVDMTGDGLVNFSVNAGSSAVGNNPQSGQTATPLNSLVNNSGKIISNGGKVLLTANAAESIVDNVINMSGVVVANSVKQQNGEIILSGGSEGTVNVTGKLIATSGSKSNGSSSSSSAGTTGGTIKVLGQYVEIESPAVINASGNAGGGTIDIGGDFHGAGPDMDATGTYVGANASILANAITNGVGGNIAIWSNEDTMVYGNISAMGGANGGNGGYVETSGGYLDVNGININLSAPHGTAGTWLLDPANITIEDSGTQTGITSSQVGDNITFTTDADASASILLTSTLVTAFESGTSVNIDTTGGTGAGNVTIASANNLNSGWTGGGQLSINATGDIIVNAALNIISSTTSSTIGLSGAQININAPITGSNLLLFLTATSTVSIAANSNIEVAGFSSTGATTLASNITSTNNLSISGGLGLTAPASGGTMITLESGGSISLPVVNLGMYNLVLEPGSASTVGSITGTGGVVVSGSTGSSVTFTGSNSYTGVTIVASNNTLNISTAQGLGSSPGNGTEVVDVNSGSTLEFSFNGPLANTTPSIIDVNGGGILAEVSGTTPTVGNAIELNAGPLNLVAAPGGSLTLSGVISGTGPVSVGTLNVSAGTVILTNDNTFTGGVTINAGTLQVSADDNLGATGSGNGITFDGSGTLQISSTSFSTDRTISLADNVVATFDTMGLGWSATSGTTANIEGIISGQGGVDIISSVNTPSIIEFSGANTYSGPTDIISASLGFGNASAIPVGSALTIGGTNAGIRSVGTPYTISNSSFTLDGSVILGADTTLGSPTSTITLAANSTIIGDDPQGGAYVGSAINGQIIGNYGLTIESGTAGSGMGSLTSTSGFIGINNASNTYTGTTTIASGAIQLGSSTAIPNGGNLTLSSATYEGTTSYGNLDLNGFSPTIGELLDSGTGFNIITNSNTSTLSTLTIGSGSYSGEINNDIAVIKTGSGTLTLSGTSSYSGATTVSGGTLAVTNNGALGGAEGGITISSGGTLDLQDVDYTIAETINLNAGGTLMTSTGSSTFAGPLVVGNSSSSTPATIDVTGTQLTLTGSITPAYDATAYLDLSGTGNIEISGGVGGYFNQINASAPILVNSNIITTNTQTYTNTVTLESNETMSAGTANINFASILGPSYTLTIGNTGGNVFVSSNVNLGGFGFSNSGQGVAVTFYGNNGTNDFASAVNFNNTGGVTLATTSTTINAFNFSNGFSTSSSTPLTLGATITSGGVVDIGSTVALNTNSSINTSSSNSNITLSGATTGAYGLTLNAGTGSITLGAAIGTSATPLASFSATDGTGGLKS